MGGWRFKWGKARLFLGILAAAVFFLTSFPLFVLAQESREATIFYNQACSDCQVYLDGTLRPALEAAGYKLSVFDYINDPSRRGLLHEWNKRWQIPISLQDNLAAFVGDRLVIEGHVPDGQIREVLANPDGLASPKILLAQPKMHGAIREVTLYDFQNEPLKIAPTDSVVLALGKMESKSSILSPERGYLAAVVAGGLANSLHPCGIAVLLVLVSFLYALRRSRLAIMTMGLLYVLGIFVTYFFIGVGLVKTISLSSRPFFFARAAALTAVVLGVVSLKDYFFPGLPLRLKIPDFTKGGIQKFIEKASLPSALVLGVLVGICAFPCTGGIYTVIITTLATAKTVSFYSYLLLYNLLFVLPLLVIVVLSGNRRVIARVEEFERRSSRKLHLVTGSLMILLGTAIYLWLRMLS